MRSIPDTLDSVEERLKEKVQRLTISISQVTTFYMDVVREEFADKPKVHMALLLPLPVVGKVIRTLNKTPDVFARMTKNFPLDEDMQVTLQFMFQG